MKIAQVVAATGAEGNPRDIERLAGYLTTQLAAAEHEVVLLSCVSPTASVLSQRWRRSPVRAMPNSLDGLIAEHSKFDIIHLHGDIHRLSALHEIATPIVATMYSHPSASMLAARAMLPEPALVALTEHQRTLFKGLRWHETILPGLPERLHPFHVDGESYLAYVGSVKSVTALRRAVEIALLSGRPLRIADRILGREIRELEQQLAPFVERGASVEFVGELSPSQLGDFLGRARALLFMDEWSDPLPLAMLDALACGTPVLAWRSRTSETVVNDGETGFLVTSVDDASLAISRLHEINRLSCRRSFDERFGIKRMTQQYVRLYEQLLQASSPGVGDTRGSCRSVHVGRDEMA